MTGGNLLGNHDGEDGDDGDDGGHNDGNDVDDAVARWERGLQGFDDDPDWWLHPLLPYAHRSQCGQVHHCQHRQHHHLPQIHDTSPHKNSSSIGMIIALSSCYRYISISNPLSSLNNVRQRRRARSSTFLSFIFLLLPGKVIIFNIFIILSIPNIVNVLGQHYLRDKILKETSEVLFVC